MRPIRWTLAAVLAFGLALGPAVAAHADTAVTASNRSDGGDTSTGDAKGTNTQSGFVGHNASDGETQVGGSEVSESSGTNVQDGDNRFISRQSSDARSGDVVAGQVIGGVSAGNLRIDATNRSTNVDGTSGSADSSNSVAAFVGLAATGGTTIGLAELARVTGTNLQDGDNRATANQVSDASSGDVVTGQIVGGVTTAGGNADLVLANRSDLVDGTSGNANQSNLEGLFVGLNVSDTLDVT